MAYYVIGNSTIHTGRKSTASTKHFMVCLEILFNSFLFCFLNSIAIHEWYTHSNHYLVGNNKLIKMNELMKKQKAKKKWKKIFIHSIWIYLFCMNQVGSYLLLWTRSCGLIFIIIAAVSLLWYWFYFFSFFFYVILVKFSFDSMYHIGVVWCVEFSDRTEYIANINAAVIKWVERRQMWK